MLTVKQAIFVGLFTLGVALAPQFALAAGNHPGESHGHEATQPKEDSHHMIEEMRKTHQDHQHEHDFEAMDKLSPEQLQRAMNLMEDIGIAVPPMDPANGRMVFTKTGCIVCHSINGIGGEIGPSLNAADMPDRMNAFEFAARMWRGAAAMTAMQEEMFGSVINLTGQELADLIAFAHDDEEQKKLTQSQIPDKIRKLIDRQ